MYCSVSFDSHNFNFPLVLPHITPFEFEGELNTGDSVQLNCYVSKGDTPLNISWKLNGKDIPAAHAGITTFPLGVRSSVLTISSIEAENAGEFTCLASNRAGQVAHSATLLVNGTHCFHLCVASLFFSLRNLISSFLFLIHL